MTLRSILAPQMQPRIPSSHIHQCSSNRSNSSSNHIPKASSRHIIHQQPRSNFSTVLPPSRNSNRTSRQCGKCNSTTRPIHITWVCIRSTRHRECHSEEDPPPREFATTPSTIHTSNSKPRRGLNVILPGIIGEHRVS